MRRPCVAVLNYGYIRLGIYIKGYQRDQAEVIRQAMRTVFTDSKLPASTWLGVESLALDDLLIKIEATAVVELE
jgi:enamine deaminase RidA (YjgF/YER057c/UK114 family)